MKTLPTPSKETQNERSVSISPSSKAMLITTLLFLFNTSFAQVFYGTISSGSGTIFKVNGDGTGYRKAELKASNGTNAGASSRGDYSQYRLNLFSNGKFYGVTLKGSDYSEGVLFEFDPITKEYSEKMEVDYYDTSIPLGKMIEYNGKLYGTSAGLGNPIYSFDPTTTILNTEFSLPSQCPGLILVNGKFYGMTWGGGLKRAGAIFEYNPATKAYKAIFQFDRTSTGHYPVGALTFANGKLYGTTSVGGKYGQGTLFEFDLSANLFTKKYDFNATIAGNKPHGDLTFYNNKLYGLTSSGGQYNQGVLFEFNLLTGVLNKALDFSSEFPSGFFQLINGKLYGTSTEGGQSGLLFSFDPETHQYLRLFEFNNDEEGTHPFGQLTLYNNALVGMTLSGGKINGGVIFKYDFATDQIENEISFGYSPLGKSVVSLIEVGDSFYGLTSEGGANDYGTLVKIDSSNFVVTKLHDFTCSQCDGNAYSFTEGQLLRIENTLYGILTKGGAVKGGELFSYDMEQERYSMLAEFNTNETGLAPVGNIAFLNGKLIGTTKQGGSQGSGVLFEYNISNNTFQAKLNLAYATTGQELRFTTANNVLYGLGYGGPLGKGVLSTYDPVTNTLTRKYEFQNSADGQYPKGSLLLQSSKLLGVCYSGVLFEFDTQTQLYRKISNFSAGGYSYDYYPIVLHGNKLYGSTYPGSLHEYNLDNNTYKGLVNFNPAHSNELNITTLIVHDGDFQTTPPVLTEVVEFNQGKRKDRKQIEAAKSDPTQALYAPNSYDSPENGIKFVSLGFGGSITLGFDIPVYDKAGIDLYIAETSYGDPSFYDYPEQAEVFVSQDAEEWIALGNTHDHSSQPGSVSGPHEACRGKLDSHFDIQTSGLTWIQYVKLVDVTDPLAQKRDRNMCAESGIIAFNAASDGFDLDGIRPISNQYPRTPSARSGSGNSTAMVDIGAPNATAQLYPNPVSDFLSINLNEEQELALMEDNFQLEIIDSQGKTWSSSQELMDDSWTINHDVSKLTPGLYIARVRNGNVRRHYKFLKK